MKRYRDCPMVFVEWVDSCTPSGLSEWVSYADFEQQVKDPTLLVHSVGYLASEDDEYIMLIGHDSGTQIHSPFFIPKVAVKSVKHLTVGKARKV